MKKRIPLALLAVACTPCGHAFAQATEFRALREMLPPREDDTNAIALEDLDGDGDLDIYTGSEKRCRVFLYEDKSGYEELPGAIALIPSGFTQDVALADLDGDGDLDAFHAQQFLFSGSVHRGNGTGTFVYDPASLPSFVGSTINVTVADPDMDGDLDVAASIDVTGDLLFLNDGAGFFTDVPFGPAFFPFVYEIAFGDVDTDGDLDAVVATSTSAELLLHDGALGFTPVPGAFAAAGPEPRTVALADLDTDGDLDVAFGQDDTVDDLFGGDGLGGFTPAPGLPPIAAKTSALIAVDIDNDLDVDLVGSTGLDSQPDLLYRNEGLLVFSDKSSQLKTPGRWGLSLAAGDLDADGDVDLVFGDNGADRVLLQNGAHEFHDVTDASADGMLVTWVALGDVEQDGFADALIFDLDGVRLLRNGGSGELAADPSAVPPFTALYPRRPSFGDLDGDGDEDFFVPFYEDQDRVYDNDGTGVFAWDSAATVAALFETQDLELGDMDGDGDLDAFGALTSDPDRLYRNDGAGNFGDEIANANAHTSVAVLFDADLDGDLDVFCGRTSTFTDVLFANDGTGTLQLAATCATETYRDGIPLDIENDGDSDLLLGGVGGSHLYRNDGGVLTDVSATLPSELTVPTSYAAVDVEPDGDVDVLATLGIFEAPNRLLRNDGTGLFVEDPFGLGDLPASTRDLAVADLDLDGDPDVCLANPEGLRILYGLDRQLARGAVPRIAKPLELDLFGPANEPWVLGYSPQTARIDLGAFGILFLEPNGIAVLATGLLGGAGEADFLLPVPADATLVGLRVPTQAVVGSQPKLTNLELLLPVAL